MFDRYAVEDSLIARLVEQNRPDVVQVFIRTHNGKAEVYVLDERGSLFCQVTEHHSSAALIACLHQAAEQTAIGQGRVHLVEAFQ